MLVKKQTEKLCKAIKLQDNLTASDSLRDLVGAEKVVRGHHCHGVEEGRHAS